VLHWHVVVSVVYVNHETPFQPRICSRLLMGCFDLLGGGVVSNPSAASRCGSLLPSRFLLTCALLMTSSHSEGRSVLPAGSALLPSAAGAGCVFGKRTVHAVGRGRCGRVRSVAGHQSDGGDRHPLPHCLLVPGVPRHLPANALQGRNNKDTARPF
jgi:hypothetical protein